jgi:hypothetical protein
MKSPGALVVSILAGVIAIVLAVKLLGAALKLVGILVGLVIAVGIYFAARRMIGSGGND